MAVTVFFSRVVKKDGNGEPLPQPGEKPKITTLIDTKAPTLKIESPRGQSHYGSDRPLKISWHGLEVNTSGESVQIEYSADDGVSYRPLGKGTLTGTYNWDLTGHAGRKFKIRLSLEDEAGHLVRVESERFSIGALNAAELATMNQHFENANRYRILGRYEEALEEYHEVFKFDIRNHKAHNDMGVVLMHVKKISKAVRSFQRAVSYQPSNVKYQFNLGYALYKNDMPLLARDSLEKVLEMDTHHVRSMWYLSEIMALNGQMEKSRKLLEKILTIDERRNQLKPLAKERLKLYQ